MYGLDSNKKKTSKQNKNPQWRNYNDVERLYIPWILVIQKYLPS